MISIYWRILIMSQKNSVLNKLVAITLSASFSMSTSLAATPQSSKKTEKTGSSSKFTTDRKLKIAGYTVIGLLTLVTGAGLAYTAWAQLFVNEILSTAESLQRELTCKTPDQNKIKKLYQSLSNLLTERIEQKNNKAPKQAVINTSTLENAQVTSEDQSENETKPIAAEEVTNMITTMFEKDDDKENENNKKDIKVNRLRWVDRDTLKQQLIDLFRKEKENKDTDSETTSDDENVTNSGELDEKQMQKKETLDENPEKTLNKKEDEENQQDNEQKQENKATSTPINKKTDIDNQNTTLKNSVQQSKQHPQEIKPLNIMNTTTGIQDKQNMPLKTKNTNSHNTILPIGGTNNQQTPKTFVPTYTPHHPIPLLSSFVRKDLPRMQPSQTEQPIQTDKSMLPMQMQLDEKTQNDNPEKKPVIKSEINSENKQTSTNDNEALYTQLGENNVVQDGKTDELDQNNNKVLKTGKTHSKDNSEDSSSENDIKIDDEKHNEEKKENASQQAAGNQNDKKKDDKKQTDQDESDQQVEVDDFSTF